MFKRKGVWVKMSRKVVIIEVMIELPDSNSNPCESVRKERLISIKGKLNENDKDILWENEDINIDRLIQENETKERGVG